MPPFWSVLSFVFCIFLIFKRHTSLYKQSYYESNMSKAQNENWFFFFFPDEMNENQETEQGGAGIAK